MSFCTDYEPMSLIASFDAEIAESQAALLNPHPGCVLVDRRRRLGRTCRRIVFREANEKMKWKMKISHKFRKFLAFSEFLSHFSAKSRDILSFPEHFCESPEKIHQIFAEKSRNSSKNANEKWNFIFIPPKIWTVFCWNFEIWAVQKYENLVDLEKPCKMSIWLLS